MDISEALADIEDGEVVLPFVKAKLGTTNAVESAVVYQASPAVTASYTCTGTTLDFTCALNG